MYVVDENLYLAHYGVKGMRWGVRKDKYETDRVRQARRNVDYYTGRRYATNNGAENLRIAKKELSDARVEAKLEATNHTPSRREEKIAKKLQNERKYTSSEAKIAAYKRARMEKAAMLLGGVAVAGLGVYLGRKAYLKNVDSFIQAGTTLQNLNNHNPQELKQVFYATLKRSDKDLYKATYARNLASRGTVYNTTIGAKSGIKVASERSARKVMDELMKNDTEFKANFKKTLIGHINSDSTSPKRVRVYKKALADLEAGKTNTRNLYDARNIFLVGRYGDIAVNNAKFYDALKKKGYGAVKDVNDMKYSGFKAKAPTIVFDTGKTYVKKAETLDPDEIVRRATTYQDKMARQALLKDSVKQLGATAGTSVGVGAVSAGVKRSQDDKVVAQYRKEHPDSELSYNEIIKMVRRK